MTAWVVRAETGEREQPTWNNNVIMMGWHELPDLSDKSKEEIRDLCETLYPSWHTPSTVGQHWAFIHDIQVGDMVVTPCQKSEFKPFIAVGRVVGNYEYGQIPPDIRHFRRVNWLKRVPRSSFSPEVLRYFNLPGTVYRLNPVAEQKINEILGGNDTSTPNLVIRGTKMRYWIFTTSTLEATEGAKQQTIQETYPFEKARRLRRKDIVFLWTLGEGEGTGQRVEEGVKGIYACGELRGVTFQPVGYAYRIPQASLDIKSVFPYESRFISENDFMQNDVLRKIDVITKPNESPHQLTREQGEEILRMLKVASPPEEEYLGPKNQIFYGPPGTGKTYKAFSRALEIINNDPSYCNPAQKKREDISKEFEERRKNGQIEFVTFHQSYSYEEFVEGIFPRLSSSDADTSAADAKTSDIGYYRRDGIFKKISLTAQHNPSKNYVLIIDEINRGNISKILGELITLLEEDKRLGKINEIQVTLPYSQLLFGVARNLNIIGTMNSADRGIALIDIALRRRFTFEPFMPEYEATGLTSLDVDGLNLGNLLKKINKKIAILLDQDHQLGHSYFMKIADTEEKAQKLYDVWYQEIIPLLQEYFYNDFEKLEMILNRYEKDAGGEKGFVERMSESDIKSVLPQAEEVGLIDTYVGNIHTYEDPAQLIGALKRYGK
jgi:hypothetical protein